MDIAQVKWRTRYRCVLQMIVPTADKAKHFNQKTHNINWMTHNSSSKFIRHSTLRFTICNFYFMLFFLLCLFVQRTALYDVLFKLCTPICKCMQFCFETDLFRLPNESSSPFISLPTIKPINYVPHTHIWSHSKCTFLPPISVKLIIVNNENMITHDYTVDTIVFVYWLCTHRTPYSVITSIIISLHLLRESHTFETKMTSTSCISMKIGLLSSELLRTILPNKCPV